MLRIGLVGCGKIADAHVSHIQHLPDCRIVGVCDREPLMARQLFERFPIDAYDADLARLLDRGRPDVVHVTTPAASHFEVARHCLERGCHVYVEKPFTLTAREAETLLDLATAKGLQITVGHDDQFTHVATRMRALIAEGYLGGSVVHMESHYGYDLGDAYARALLGDQRHWVRQLPGQLLHNIISHGIARIAEYVPTDSPRVIVHGFTSPRLLALGEDQIIDELRVMVSVDSGRTAYFTFSSQMRPSIHQFRVFGPENGLVLDQDQDVLIRLRGAKFKSYAEKFVPPLSLAKQLVENWATNARAFLARDLHLKAGMRRLIELFYRSIREDGPPPIPHREILLTARIMDDIFEQISEHRRRAGGRGTPVLRRFGS